MDSNNAEISIIYVSQTGIDNSSDQLAQKLGLPTIDTSKRKHLLTNTESPLHDETMIKIIDQMSITDLEDDSYQYIPSFFRFIVLAQELTIQEFQDFLQPIIDGNKNRFISFPDLNKAYQGLYELTERIRKDDFNSEILNIANGAIHSTSAKNGLSDVKVGYFRPSKEFGNDRNSTISRLYGEKPDHYQRYIDEKHDEYVFFTSSCLGGMLHNSRLYSHGEPSITFFTNKTELSKTGVKQEANQTLTRYYNEVRLEGRVPVSVSSIIFTDSRTAEEQTDQLSQFDIHSNNELAAIDLITAFTNMFPSDPERMWVDMLPRGSFDFIVRGSNGEPTKIDDNQIKEMLLPHMTRKIE